MYVDYKCLESPRCTYFFDHDAIKVIKSDVDYSHLSQYRQNELVKIPTIMIKTLWCLMFSKYESGKPIVLGSKCSLDQMVRECLEPRGSSERANLNTVECNLVISVDKAPIHLIVTFIVTDLHSDTWAIRGCLIFNNWFSSWLPILFMLLMMWILRIMTDSFFKRFHVQCSD